MLRLRFVALCGATIVAAPPATAQRIDSPPQRLRLAWVRAAGAESCPGPRAIVDAVEARLGREVFSSDASQSVEVTIARTPGPSWTVSLYLRDLDGTLLGTRTLTSDRTECEAAVAAAAFAVALTVDPDGAVAPSTPRAESAEPRSALSLAALELARAAFDPLEPPRPATRPPSTMSPPSPDRSQPALASVSIGAWGAVGVLPRLAPGVMLHGYARLLRRFGLRASMRFAPEQRVETAELGDVSFGLSSATVLADLELAASQRAGVSLSLGPSIGALHAIVHDRPPADTGARPIAAMHAVTVGSLRVSGPFALEAGVELALALVRYRYGTRLETSPTSAFSSIFEQPWLSAGAWFALSARLP